MLRFVDLCVAFVCAVFECVRIVRNYYRYYVVQWYFCHGPPLRGGSRPVLPDQAGALDKRPTLVRLSLDSPSQDCLRAELRPFRPGFHVTATYDNIHMCVNHVCVSYIYLAAYYRQP